MSNFIKFTFDIFAHVIPGLIILVAFSLLTISIKSHPANPLPTESKIEKTKYSKKDESKETMTTTVNYGMFNELIKNLENTEKGVIVIILAYIIGFAINPLGKKLHTIIGPKLWPKIYVENEIKGMPISDKFVLIREYSPANFEYVERWNMYSALSQNLAVGCLVFFVVAIIQLFLTGREFLFNWMIVVVLSFIMFFIFIRSARIYYQWAGRDLNSSISELKLREK